VKQVFTKKINVPLLVVLAISAMLNLTSLTQEGYGNTYYAAAVKSMLLNWHNFFFVSFDPGGFVTVDKPPLALWIQAASASVFGFQGWSLLLPQAIAGILSVALLYHLVSKVFGRKAGILSALIMAITPIAVAVDRTNEVDSILVFTVLVATWAFQKAMESGRLRWLLIALAIVGIGFNVKMLQAYMVLPAFYLVYLLASQASWRKKILHLGIATVILLAVSLSWALVVDSTPPDQRPYIGSSSNNSVLDLALGYNGVARFTGNRSGFGGFGRYGENLHHLPSGERGTGMIPHGNFASGNLPPQYMRFAREMRGMGGMFGVGSPGLFRMFSPQLVGQISWFLPMVVFSVIALLARNRLRFPLNRKQQETIFWTAWLVPMTVFFSFAQFIHQYYTVMMAPAIAALSGAGLVAMWKAYRKNRGWRRWLLPCALLSTAALHVYILAINGKYIGLTFSILAGILALLVTLVLFFLKVKWPEGKNRLPYLTTLVGILVLMAGPFYWATTPVQYGGNPAMPSAGPELQLNHRFSFMRFTSDPKLIQYLLSHRHGETYLVATMNAMTAAPLILTTNQPVIAMGGFSGRDPAMTVEKLEKMTSSGEVRYFLIPSSDMFGPGMFGSGMFGQQGKVLDWIRQHCRAVPRSQWQSKQTPTFGMRDMREMQQLYEYVKK
jgi:4-amino-4-deoxy-L-arabinose transferase-like glycosyltransferase